jgi:hypothetical protein
MRLLFPGLILLLFTACNNTHTTPAVTKNDSVGNTPDTTVPPLAVSTINKDTIILSAKHNPNYILCDLDGDQLLDSVILVQHTVNKKYGLLVKFGNNNMTTLGLGQDVLQQGFDDLDWVGVFEKASRGDIYWNNVNDEGEIIGEEQVPEQDKIKLPNDGIFIHAAESCGGGVIYLKNGKFEWIQQE